MEATFLMAVPAGVPAANAAVVLKSITADKAATKTMILVFIGDPFCLVELFVMCFIFFSVFLSRDKSVVLFMHHSLLLGEVLVCDYTVFSLLFSLCVRYFV
jgi:hypothetical protein